MDLPTGLGNAQVRRPSRLASTGHHGRGQLWWLVSPIKDDRPGQAFDVQIRGCGSILLEYSWFFVGWVLFAEHTRVLRDILLQAPSNNYRGCFKSQTASTWQDLRLSHLKYSNIRLFIFLPSATAAHAAWSRTVRYKTHLATLRQARNSVILMNDGLPEDERSRTIGLLVSRPFVGGSRELDMKA